MLIAVIEGRAISAKVKREAEEIGLGTWRLFYPGKEREQHFVTTATPREAMGKALDLAKEHMAHEVGARSGAP